MKAFVRKACIYLWHAAVCLAVLVGIFAMLWAVSYTQSVRHRRDAERLLRDLKNLPSGAAGTSRAAEIANRFGAAKHCIADHCRYDFGIGFAVSKSGLLLPFRRTEWDYLGVRPWYLEAEIEQRNNEVSQTSFDLTIARGRGWIYNQGLLVGNIWGWWVISLGTSPEGFAYLVNSQEQTARRYGAATRHQIPAGANGIIIERPNLNMVGGGQGLRISLSPSSTPESKAIGFDVNLQCTTAISSCTELCQIVPSAWQSYSQYQESNGWYVEHPQNCPVALPHSQ